MTPQAGCLEWSLLGTAGVGAADGDRELIARARRGELSAFDEIVRRHQRRVYNLAYRMLRRREDAEDVTQEAFLRAFQSLRGFRSEADVGVWICRITANLCVDWLRSKARREEAADPTRIASAYADERHRKGDELARDARAAVAQLPPKYRLAVVAFYLEGRSYEEAARVVGVGVRTLKTRLYRARRMLRETVQETVFCDQEVGR